ncbi:glycosyltransferase family 39 protein [Desulfovibrio sp. Huiquan2017]|uniref:ArnT family glycosyltransferase n=1 Tax=Desulfovibrio sp. Huiquan2017 TaxID=2816861 RepID=UPI001A932634|nr:glycosyltransferase family 39 protein [Desulfovibrio sp. Huiquan2017]
MLEQCIGHGKSAYRRGAEALDKWDSFVAAHRRRSLWIMVVLVVAVSLLIRYATAQRIDMGGDAFFKWGLIREAIAHGPLPVAHIHHGLRWALNFPVYFIQLAFGDSVGNYYIWPMLSSTVTAVFSFLLIERIANWRWGALAAMFVMTSGRAAKNGSQFLPLGPCTMYMLGALFFLVLYLQTGKKRAVVASAILLFFSYGAKITAIYYFPAFLLVLLLCPVSPSQTMRRRFPSMLIFVAVLGLLFAAETGLIYKTTGEPGRITALNTGAHGTSKDEAASLFSHGINKARKYFASNPYALPPYPDNIEWRSFSVTPFQYALSIFVYLKAYRGFIVCLFMYIAAILAGIIVYRRRKELYPLAVPYLFGFLGHAYAIRSIDPFIRPERILSRYLTLVTVLSMLVLLGFVYKKYVSGNTKAKKRITIFITLLLLAQSADHFIKHARIPNGIQHALNNQRVVEQARQEHRAIAVSAASYKFPWGYACFFGKLDAEDASAHGSSGFPIIGHHRKLESLWGKLNPDTITSPQYIAMNWAFDKTEKKLARFYEINSFGYEDRALENYLVFVEYNGNTPQEALNNYVELEVR